MVELVDTHDSKSCDSNVMRVRVSPAAPTPNSQWHLNSYMNELIQKFFDLETTLLKPEARSSYKELNRLLANDFTEFGSSGSVYRKSDTLARLVTTTDKVVYEVSDFEAKGLSENFVLTTFKAKRIINDADIVVSLRSSLWKKTDGNWQMFFHQGTPIK